MLRTCDVKEIILNGDQSEEEQQRIVAWHHQLLALDQAQVPGAPLSLDVEEVHCTLMDVLHLSGRRPHQGERVYLHDKPGRTAQGPARAVPLQVDVGEWRDLGVDDHHTHRPQEGRPASYALCEEVSGTLAYQSSPPPQLNGTADSQDQQARSLTSLRGTEKPSSQMKLHFG